MPAQRPYLDGPRPRAFAHRGWHIDELEGMENSLPAFRRAYEEDFGYLETDVQVTGDGVVVVNHDETLDRTTDSSGTIEQLPWSQVRRAKINGVEPVSRLQDVLEELPYMRFNIDVKADAALEPFVRTITRCNALDRVAAASFSTRRLARVRQLAGDRLAVAMPPLSVGLAWAGRRVPFLPRRTWIRGAMAQVPLRFRGLPLVDDRFIRKVQRIGAEVHVWTINDAAQMHRLLDAGVDGLISDRPDLLRQVLVERDVWAPR